MDTTASFINTLMKDKQGGAKCKVQIEEKLEGSGRNAKNAVSKAFEYFQSYFCKLWIRLS